MYKLAQKHAFAFNKLRNDKERLEFARSVFPEKTIELGNTKSLEKAESLKATGNIIYKDKNYVTAIKCYYEALANAPPDTDIIPLLYANLSACHYGVGCYKSSLACIEAAFEHGYAKGRETNLTKRQEKCKTRISEEEAKMTADKKPKGPQLSCPPMENIPMVADCLEFVPGAERWSLIAAKDIKAGDNLLTEKSFFSCIGQNERFICCAYCLDFSKALFPCRGCCDTLFCSEECQAAAESFHQYDCGLPWPDSDETRGDRLKLFLRIFLTALKHFPTVEAVRALLEEVDTDPMGFAEADFNAEPDKERIRTLISAKAKVTSPLEPIFMTFGAVSMFRALLAKEAFAARYPSADDRQVMQMLLYQLCHAVCSDGVMKTVLGKCTLEGANANVFPFFDTIDDVFDANVGNCNQIRCGMGANSVRLLFALRPIKAGTKIAVNSSFKHVFVPFVLATLNQQMSEAMQIITAPDPYLNSLPVVGLNTDHLMDAPDESIRRCVEFLTVNERYRPCKELHQAELFLSIHKMLFYIIN